MSHPVWVRGLKPISDELKEEINRVAPCMGAWIETFTPTNTSGDANVAPCMGAWIETTFIRKQYNKTFVAPCMGAWIETSVPVR